MKRDCQPLQATVHAKPGSADTQQKGPAPCFSHPIRRSATVVDASAFKSGRHFAAWIGLVPQQNGFGGSRQNLEEGRTLLAAVACARRYRCGALRPQQAEFCWMGERAVGAKTSARRNGRGREQTCAHRLGHHATWRTIPREIVRHSLISGLAMKRHAIQN